MPVSEKAVSKSIKSTHDNPGESRYAKRDKIPFSQLFWNPAKKVEANKCDMEYNEKAVRNFIQCILHLDQR